MRPFDPPGRLSSFADTRAKNPDNLQTLSGRFDSERSKRKTTQLGYKQNLLDRHEFSDNRLKPPIKVSSNSSFNSVNPSLQTHRAVSSVNQPLAFAISDSFPNRAPIPHRAAQLKAGRAPNFTNPSKQTFIPRIIGDYWSVVLARENLSVQEKSLGRGPKRATDHDKKAL